MWVDNHNHNNWDLNMKYYHDKNNFSFHHESHLPASNENDFHNYIFAHLHYITNFSIIIKHEKFWYVKDRKKESNFQSNRHLPPR